MVDSRRDVAGQAGRSPSPSVQATMIGLMAILLWSLMTGLVRVVADAFGATLGSALIYTCGAVLLLVFRRPAPLRKYPRTYLIVGGLLFIPFAMILSAVIGTKLDPKGNATRAQVAVLVDRAGVFGGLVGGGQSGELPVAYNDGVAGGGIRTERREAFGAERGDRTGTRSAQRRAGSR